jgi:pimeloyl-ACP methyl ester carboxylesterase
MRSVFCDERTWPRRRLARLALGAALTGLAPRRGSAQPGSFILQTRSGPVEMRYGHAPGERAVAFVGGAGGGFDSPARDLYGRLAAALPGEGIASLRLRFRRPTDLEASVADLSAGVAELERRGKTRIGLIGHSFGGAVVIHAAAAARSVRAVIALATQSYGAQPVQTLGPRCSVLLIHGTADRVLPPEVSRTVYEMAAEPKRLVLIDGAGHGLQEASEEVEQLVRAWLAIYL